VRSMRNDILDMVLVLVDLEDFYYVSPNPRALLYLCK
jgi:hypothetical protein